MTPAFFAAGWLLPLAVGAAAWVSPWAAWGCMFAVQVGLAAAERWPALARSPPPRLAPGAGFRAVLRTHVALQAALLAGGVTLAPQMPGWAGVVALGLGVGGGVTGSQGITFAHELGHGRSRTDRVLAWCLMCSVLYAHFMVEHYCGHHVRVATADDPATARRGESLWRFLPRTMAGSLLSAWRLEARQLRLRSRRWRHSDHHLHAWKPYEILAPLDGPRLPTGYAGCLFLASLPTLWFRAMEPRLARLGAQGGPARSEQQAVVL